MKQISTKGNTLKVYIFLLTLLFNVTLSNSSEIYKNIFSIDLGLGTAYNIHKADFNAFKGMYNCCNFGDASHFGILGGIDLNYNLANSLEVFVGIDYADRSATLSYDEVLSIYNETTKLITQVTNRYNLEANLKNIEIELGFKYILVQDFISGPLKLISAGKLFFPLTSDFIQMKEAVSPEGHVLNINGENVLEYEMASGNISDRYSPGLGFNVGIQNHLISGEKTSFTQSISFDYCFSNIVDNVDWKHYSINLLLGFNFDVYGEINSSMDENIQTLAEEKAPVKDSATIIPVIRDTINPKLNFAKIISDFHIEKGYELLCSSPKITCIFFDKDSNKIPDSYLQYDKSISQFSNPIKLHNNILYDILAILESNRNATITLAALNSGDEEVTLVDNRIEEVKNFFLKNGIDGKRIRKTESINKSNEKFETGYSENRRVDINLEEVLLTDFVSKNMFDNVVGYSKIELDTLDILFPKRLKIEDKYEKYITMKSDMLHSYKIPSAEYDESLHYKVTYMDTLEADTTFKFPKARMRIEQHELKTDNFMAVLTFDYNSDQLSDISKQTLLELLQFLPEGVTIMISGSADISGTKDRNEELTQRRANNAKSFLEKNSNGKVFKFIETIDSERYSNATPVGRFLNRSIRIKIKKED